MSWRDEDQEKYKQKHQLLLQNIEKKNFRGTSTHHTPLVNILLKKKMFYFSTKMQQRVGIKLNKNFNTEKMTENKQNNSDWERSLFIIVYFSSGIVDRPYNKSDFFTPAGVAPVPVN